MLIIRGRVNKDSNLYLTPASFLSQFTLSVLNDEGTIFSAILRPILFSDNRKTVSFLSINS